MGGSVSCASLFCSFPLLIFLYVLRYASTSGQTPLLSRFVGAFSPDSPTGTNNPGLKLVPVGPRTGTEEAPRGQARSEGGEGALVPVDSKNRDQRGPRGQARSEGGRGHWSRLIAITGTKEAALFL